MKNRTLNAPCIVASLLCALSCSASGQTQDSTTTFTYDTLGNLTQVSDPLAHITKYAYDALRRRITVTDAANKVISNTYDGLDQLTVVTDPRNVATSYVVDGLGNLTQTTSADAGATINTYDDAGNIKSSTDAKGQVSTYQYDVLNRVTTIAYSDGSSVTYQYDHGINGIGRLSQITDSGGTIAFAYDVHGRVTVETRTFNSASYVTGYRYDAAGRLSGMTYPSGRLIDYARDAMGRINQITSTRDNVVQPLVTQVLYQPFGAAKSLTFGNGQQYQRTFDLDGRIASFTLGNQTQAISYDAASRISSIADQANVATGNTYAYDLVDRLTNYVSPNASASFSYDAVGNRTQKSVNSTVTSYAYSATSNRLAQAGTQIMTTDANGSITNNIRNQFSYDARGRMVSATTAIGLVQYKINALGQRVQKITPSESTVFHYDSGGKLISETTTAGTTSSTVDYVYLGDLPVAVLK